MISFLRIRLALVAAVLCLLSSCTLGAPALKVEDGVIEGKVIWSGEVHIDGIVTVKKTGHLTIKPGTRVLLSREIKMVTASAMLNCWLKEL